MSSVLKCFMKFTIYYLGRGCLKFENGYVIVVLMRLIANFVFNYESIRNFRYCIVKRIFNYLAKKVIMHLR